ncbi:MAG: HU family DNA-binding protein [Azoarcus sp.]|jgi:predicted histone-like DNA-binding protein|nr:HU family DNA-binding protein [Azoarcus sp.]
MSVRLRKITRTSPRNPKESKWYLSKVSSGLVDLKDIARDIEKQTSVTRADISAVLISLAETLPNYLKNGQSVRFGDLGIFRVSISSEGAARPEELSARDVKSVRIVFTPGVELKDSLGKVSFEIVA